MRDVMTIPEAAEILQLSRSTVYDMARTGELPVVRIRSRLRITRQGMETYLARLQTDLQTQAPDPFARRRAQPDKP